MDSQPNSTDKFMHHPLSGLQLCLEDIFSPDPSVFEDAFECLTWGEEPPVRDFLPELIGFLRRHLRAFDRGKVLELLGYTESRLAIEPLRRHLRHPELSVRKWALLALQQLDFPESREVAAQFLERNPATLDV
jgi:HEAT repeat protein